MTRLVQERRSTMQQTRDSLAALSSPRQYLEFALNSKLTGEQVSEVAVSFMRKFGRYVPETFLFAHIGYDELLTLLAQAANNYDGNGAAKNDIAKK